MQTWSGFHLLQGSSATWIRGWDCFENAVQCFVQCSWSEALTLLLPKLGGKLPQSCLFGSRPWKHAFFLYSWDKSQTWPSRRYGHRKPQWFCYRRCYQPWSSWGKSLPGSKVIGPVFELWNNGVLGVFPRGNLRWFCGLDVCVNMGICEGGCLKLVRCEGGLTQYMGMGQYL